MSIRLLQIASVVPFPLLDGGRVGIYHIVRQYARHGVEVDFAAPYTNESNYDGFCKLCNLHLLDIDTRYKVTGGIKNLFSNIPYNVEKYHSLEAYQQLDVLVSAKRFDVIQAESLHMAEYALRLKEKYHIPIILREHNFQAEIIKRYAETVQNPVLKFYLQFNYKKMLHYEAATVTKFDKVLTVSETDDVKLHSIAPGVKSTVIPAGVDCEQYYYQLPSFKPAVVFLLNYEWLPNIDAFRYYFSEIFPLLQAKMPQIQTIVVGRSTEKIPKEFWKEGLVFKGFVEDFNSIATFAPVAIMPLRIGGGMRIKLVELMAKGMAIVSTSVGAEGVTVQDGENILIADSPEDFVEAVLKLLNSPDECIRIGKNARKLVEECYSWNIIGDKLFHTLQSVIC